MGENNVLISIIVASFNNEDTIQRCIDSVACQTYPHRELVIIDGASRDGTQAILEASTREIAYWESKPDRGQAHALNKALAHAKGDWVQVLGADDYLWEPDALERLAPHLAGAYPPTRVVYARVNSVSKNGDILYECGQPWHKVKKTFLQMMHNYQINHQGVLLHRSFFEKHGGFDESFLIAVDYELLLRELKDNDALFVPDVVVAAQQHGGISCSLEHRPFLLKELARAASKNRVRGFPYLRHWAWVKTLTRICILRLFGERASNHITDGYRRLTGRPAKWTK
jgi:glycosyltransferase involved in cell wall biosynthesis